MATTRTSITTNSVPPINRENQIQSGTIPVGASAGTFKVPLNISTPVYGVPTDVQFEKISNTTMQYASGGWTSYGPDACSVTLGLTLQNTLRLVIPDASCNISWSTSATLNTPLVPGVVYRVSFTITTYNNPSGEALAVRPVVGGNYGTFRQAAGTFTELVACGAGTTFELDFYGEPDTGTYGSHAMILSTCTVKTEAFTFPIEEIREDSSILLAGNWFDLFAKKIKSGDHIVIKRGNIVRNFTAKYATVIDEGTANVKTLVRLNTTDVQELVNFVGKSGFPYSSNESMLFLGANSEISSKPDSLLKTVDYKQYTLNQTGENFNAEIFWEVDPTVKAVMIRWRSVPRYQSRKSLLNFQVAAGGTYSIGHDHNIMFPTASVVSSTGRGAKLKLTGTIVDTEIHSGGTAYPPGPGLLILLDDGDGTGASVDAYVAGPGPNYTSVTAINLYTGGTGYTHVPAMGFTGGIGASAFFSLATVSNVILLEDGGSYFSMPSVSLTGGSGSGASIYCSSYELQQTGSLDYVRVIEQGQNYSDAAYALIVGGSGASASLVIENGKIVDVKLTASGKNFTFPPTINVYDVGGGTGASLRCNVDYLSEWNYEPAIYEMKRTILSNLKKNVPYEFQILVSTDKQFKGNQMYSDSHSFGYFQA